MVPDDRTSADGATSQPALPEAAPAARVVTAARRERIERARQAVGESGARDHVVEPRAHADALETAAPEFAARLRRTDTLLTAERFRELDEAAGTAQRSFAAQSGRARDAVLLTGVVGALLVGTGSLAPVLGDTTARLAVVALSFAAVMASAVAASALRVARDGQALGDWMSRRADAEGARLAYHAFVTQFERCPEPLVPLEYFRRYQLDVQRAYFRRRGGEHRTARDRLLRGGAIAIGVAGAASALAGLLGASVGPAWAAVGAVALVAQALAAHRENAEASAQHRRNAERYARMYDALTRIGATLDDVREATAAGDLAVPRQFVAAVHEQLASEYAQWQQDLGAASTAVGRLAELLEEYKAKRPAAA